LRGGNVVITSARTQPGGGRRGEKNLTHSNRRREKGRGSSFISAGDPATRKGRNSPAEPRKEKRKGKSGVPHTIIFFRREGKNGLPHRQLIVRCKAMAPTSLSSLADQKKKERLLYSSTRKSGTTPPRRNTHLKKGGAPQSASPTNDAGEAKTPGRTPKIVGREEGRRPSRYRTAFELAKRGKGLSLQRAKKGSTLPSF